MDWTHLQWPAMVATLLASWFVSSKQSKRRTVGFWIFLASNVLWGAWAIVASATALLLLQLPLAALNIRGMVTNSRQAKVQTKR